MVPERPFLAFLQRDLLNELYMIKPAHVERNELQRISWVIFILNRCIIKSNQNNIFRDQVW